MPLHVYILNCADIEFTNIYKQEEQMVRLN